MPVLTQWHGGVLGLALLVLVGVVDVWATPTRLVRKWSKPTWWTVVLIPGIGLLTWVTMGRPRGNAGAPCRRH